MIMTSFKHFIIEQTGDISSEIDQYLSAGEIVKPQYDDLKRKADRAIEKERRIIFDKHVFGKASENDAAGVGDLAYDLPDNVHSVGSFGKKLEKLPQDHEFVKDSKSLYNKWLPVHQKMKSLKDKIVTVSAKRIENKKSIENIKKERFGDSTTLVGALTKHLEEFKTKAGERAGEHFDWLVNIMKQHNWNLDDVAPRPNSRMSTSDYKAANSRRMMFISVTDQGAGDTRIYSPGKRISYVQQAINGAHEDYMAWINKMIEKIGKPVTGASISGDPWQRSRLEVETSDGERQVWYTTMIINYSKYNKAFNQFPSRKEK